MPVEMCNKVTHVPVDDDLERWMEVSMEVADDPDAEPHPDYFRLSHKYCAIQGAVVGMRNGGPSYMQIDAGFLEWAARGGN